MTRKLFAVSVALLMMLSSVAMADVPAFEDIVFPENLPSGIVFADSTYDYSYDDMTETYDLEILMTNYGTPTTPADEGPISTFMAKAFNLNLTLTTVSAQDIANQVSVRFAADDAPDLLDVNMRDIAFTLSDQGLLLDTRDIYPYMPLRQQYVTESMIKWSTNTANGEIPFVTQYGIQDGVWCGAVRADWLEKFGMEVPTTREELMEYAKKCATEDPNENGVADTWFMTSGSDGIGFGSIDSMFATMAGPAHAYVDDSGKLSHPYFNGVRKTFLEFVKELLDEGTLGPDWYTINWSNAAALWGNDQIGMVYYPAGAMFAEYREAQGSKEAHIADNWVFLADYPIEGGKNMAVGEAGYKWGFSTAGFGGNEGKIKRVAHMLDTCMIGGENFSHTAQDGDDAVYEAFGLELLSHHEYIFTEDNMFYIKVTGLDENGKNQFPYDPDTFVEGSWQMFGLAVGWQLSDPESGDPQLDYITEKVNESSKIIAGIDRWPNYGMLITLTGEAAEANESLKDWIYAAEYEFVTGARDLADYESFQNEWLSKGGKVIIEQTAASLGVDVPEYAQ